LVLSMEDPSTIRRAVADIIRAPYGGDSRAGQTGGEQVWDSMAYGKLVPRLFYVRNMFFCPGGVLTCFRPQWPSLKFTVA
jgi:hypothetical protein